MTKQQFIDKYVGKILAAGIGTEHLRLSVFIKDAEEAFNELEDVEYDRGYKRGWLDATATFPSVEKNWSENN